MAPIYTYKKDILEMTKSSILSYLVLIIVLTVWLISPTLSAQSPLQQRRQRIERELQRTGRELKTTRSQKGAALTQAGQLKTQITQREELILTLEEEAARNTERLRRDSSAVAALTADLTGIIDEYGQTLRAANRARLLDGWTVFLFNAKGVNDVFRRMIYLRQYQKYRTRQALAVRQTREKLSGRVVTLQEERMLRDSLLRATVEQGTILQGELKVQDRLVKKLSTSERALLKKVKKQESIARSLRRQVSSAIDKDVAKKARTRSAKKGKKTGAVATATSANSNSIANRRGRLGWPVEGRIVRKFGKQPHPDVPSVIVDNRGVDIEGGKQAAIAAIYAGKVVDVTGTGGGRSMVLVSHGNFYSVYSNLEFPQVKTGDELAAGKQIGLTARDGSALHFELWRGKVALDPGGWLR
ncbi:murein hydrolase activator EnvC family protein [Neolewinella antarctica]|uniref:Septal ring factor EnvC (AmiA/AmiB activator) n=1 Tax=Neolewinella antarctica TaxID=442734 RepID=A0ABX0XG38_9BACT|nr:peptidoglycan DD-metalloendopeptidase family protein [Neolewinella antarctica]NJC28201.1 septal ring factor EnvC (AmiA/AmiB activator) [Neolewinella antarctica]